MKLVDQIGREIEIGPRPKRIISLVPSITELLYYLGIVPVAQTIFCIHPSEHFKNSVKIGGTKNIKIGKIKSLKPDLIIANKEENERKQIEELGQTQTVFVSDISSIQDLIEFIDALASALGVIDKAAQLQEEINSVLNGVPSADSFKAISYVYLIWMNPYFVVGENTFITHMLGRFGFRNALKDVSYQELDRKQIEALNPEIIFLSSEPFPFTEKHRTKLKSEFPKSKLALIDGAMTSWYGSRIPEGLRYLHEFRSNLD